MHMPGFTASAETKTSTLSFCEGKQVLFDETQNNGKGQPGKSNSPDFGSNAKEI
jgi:hypothetical protein